MNNNNNQKIEILKPLIFSKKVNLKHKIIPLDVITNTTGPIRFFPPATKEWFNSIYTYNKNSVKNLSVADKTLSRLIKSYFNFYFNKEVVRSKRRPTRIRRLSLNKVFISKAELKHTNSKVNITLYIYNEEKRLLMNKLEIIENKIVNSEDLILNVSHDIEQHKKRIPLIKYLDELQFSVFITLSSLKKKVNPNAKTRKTIVRLESYLDKIIKTITLSKNDNDANKTLDQIYTNLIRKSLLYEEIKEIASLKLLLNLNKLKFGDEFLVTLKNIIGEIYNKQVEFNIVNLKTLYFNSDIFTEAISIRLKNRKNSLLHVLNSSLNLVELPIIDIKEKYGRPEKLCLDHLNNIHVNSVIRSNENQDTLDQLLLNILPYSTVEFTTDEGSLEQSTPNNYSNTYNPLDLVINSLKYKAMAGVRLEAKGRLTRRFTASRSVFKVKWKGTIKNLDSSYKNLTSVLLRGHAKSNVQYSIINSKTRNGAFGLKGWISSK